MTPAPAAILALPLLASSCLTSALLSVAVAQTTTPAAYAVPVVSCAADGQQGPIAADANPGTAPPIPASVARQLAYYAFSSLGVYAPRGWHCFGLYGSNGTQLIVTPERHSGSDLLAVHNPRLSGPAIQVFIA